MNINILAGGPAELLPSLAKYQTDLDMWIGVDKGVFTLLFNGIEPSKAFGDFDSVTRNEMMLIEEKVKDISRFKPEKDETDMELALNWALEQNPELIRLFGATGGRLDHFFANIQLLINPIVHQQFVPIEIVDHKNVIYLKAAGNYSLGKHNWMKYVSFIPITQEVTGLTLKGFKYPLTDYYLSLGSTRCISNELIDDNGNFSFSEGILMIVRSTD